MSKALQAKAISLAKLKTTSWSPLGAEMEKMWNKVVGNINSELGLSTKMSVRPNPSQSLFHPQQTFNSKQTLKRNIMTPSTKGSLVRQNYHEDCEGEINKQINLELYASLVYISMAYYFDRDDVAFPGLHKFCKKSSDEEREHAEKLMKYQNQRGGRIILQQIAKPANDDWNSPLGAITAALELEKSLNANLLRIHGIAGANSDPQLCDFLETHFLEHQIKSIKDLADYSVQLKRCGPGVGEFIFDKEMEENP